MPTIQGLTQLQKELCEEIWQCNSEQEVLDLIRALPKNLRRQAQTLTNLIIIESIDDEITEAEHFDQARDVIARFRG
jgi:hypothetical protein